MRVSSTSVQTCPLVYRRPANQAALEAGLREAQRSAALPADGDSMAIVSHPVFVAVARELQRSSVGLIGLYCCLSETESIAWTAISLDRCQRSLGRDEALYFCRMIGLASVIDRDTGNLKRTEPGMVGVSQAADGRPVLVCPLWHGRSIDVGCVLDVERFAQRLRNVGVYCSVDILDDILAGGARDSLLKMVVDSKAAARRSGKEARHDGRN